MASIFGHAIAGAIAGQTFRTGLKNSKARVLLLLAILLALLPDFDVVIYILFEPAGMSPHRGFTHGFPFLFLIAFVTAFSTRKHFFISATKLFLIYFTALLSHTTLDFLMGAGPEIPLFSPFSDVSFISPITLIPWSYYSTNFKNLFEILYYPPALLGYCLELFIFVPLLIITRRTQKPTNTIALSFISVITLLTTYVFYN